MSFDNPNPTIMEDFIRALAQEPVVYPYCNESGWRLTFPRKKKSENGTEYV